MPARRRRAATASPATALPPAATLRAGSHPLSPVLGQIAHLADLPSLTSRLSRQTPGLPALFREAVLTQVEAYTQSRHPQVVAQLDEHGSQHLAELLRLLAGAQPGDFSFVSKHARRLAEQFFPLDALLHAYRCLHRVLAACLREAANDASVQTQVLAEFALEYVDHISTIASVSYAEQARQLAQGMADEDAALLDLLLSGCDESDRRVRGALQRAGYLDGRQAFCVVLAQSVDPSHMRDAARARRLADAVEALVPAAMARRLVSVRNGTVTLVLAAVRRVSGWTAVLPPLSSRVAAELSLAGNDVLIGIGPDVEALSQIPSAHRKAMLALQLAHVGRRVLRFEQVSLRELLLHQATPALREMLPPWLEAFDQADTRLGGALSGSLRAYALADLNLLKAAATLQVHPNTLYARFERIREISGLDPKTYPGLETLLLVMDMAVKGLQRESAPIARYPGLVGS